MRTMGRIAVIAALSAMVFVGTSVGACSGDGSGGAPADVEPDIEGVIYAGLATDEALLAMLRAEETSVPSQAVVVDAPAEGATLPKDVPPTIAWHVGGSAASNVEPSRNSFGIEIRSLIDWLGPREAHAHGAPVNGRAYFLVFSTPKSPGLVRVFTTDLEYTFDAGSWTTLALTGEPITLRVTNAIFEDNRVAQDGGPWAGEPVTFSIGP